MVAGYSWYKILVDAISLPNIKLKLKKMKTRKIVIAVIGCMAGVILSSCQSKEQKVEHAEENVTKANEDLREAQTEFKNEAEITIRENENEIKMYRDNLKDQKVADKENYERRIDSLERQNEEMRRKLNEYNGEGQTNERWESFKREFNHDMEGLKNSIRAIGKDNTK
jgi:cell shape-determining protein MreC